MENDISVRSDLNEAQLKAVLHVDGPLLVLSGAGTGKTKVLTERIISLVQNNYALPDQILAVTFTNKAAKEMVYRVSQKIENNAGLWLGTFHAIATKILRRHAEYFDLTKSFNVLGMDDQLKMIKRISEENNIDIKEYPPQAVLGIIQRWKDLVLLPHHISKNDLITIAHQIAFKLYPVYQKQLIMNNAVDFGDLLIYNIELLSKNADIQEIYTNNFKYILVDEYQDTNVAQYMWLRLMTGKNNNLCCVGDEDQSIYGWRGAEIDNILRFSKDFPTATVIRLEQNYRSTNNILATAAFLIAHNTERLGKNLWSKSESGEKVKLITLSDDIAEAKYIAQTVKKIQSNGTSYSEIAILVRATFQTRLIEEYFVAEHIPYRMIGGLKFYERQEIKDAIGYLRVVANQSDNLAFERIINVPRRGIGESTFSMITEYAFNNEISLIAATKAMLHGNIFKSRIQKTLNELMYLIDSWSSMIENTQLSDCLEIILKQSGYIQMWQNEKSKEAEAKLENIKELIAVIKDFNNITDLLEYISLVNDEIKNDEEAKVNIMTIHAAKGLEFEAVILPGWEDGVFPHQRVIKEYNNKSLEEERRLAYVAITRAKRDLYITKAQRRKMFGVWQNTNNSRFIEELPKENITILDLYFSNNDFSFKKYNQSNYFSNPISNAKIKANKFNIGDRVSHKKFGAGYIIGIEEQQLKISFDFFGTKILLDKFIEKS